MRIQTGDLIYACAVILIGFILIWGAYEFRDWRNARYTGYLYEVVTWNRTLTPPEIAYLNLLPPDNTQLSNGLYEGEVIYNLTGQTKVLSNCGRESLLPQEYKDDPFIYECGRGRYCVHGMIQAPCRSIGINIDGYCTFREKDINANLLSNSSEAKL